MKSTHAVIIILLGWLIFVSYLFYDYSIYGTGLLEHLLSIEKSIESLFHIIVLCALLGSHITGYLINERKILLEKTIKSEEQLKHAAHEWKMTFDSIPHGVMITDNNCNIKRANKYVERLTGIPVKKLVTGLKCSEVICNNSTSAFDCAAMITSGVKGSITYNYRNKKEGIAFRETVSPMTNSNGKSISLVHVLIDITASNKKEEKLAQSKDAFFNMLKDLDSSYKDLQDIHNSLIVTFSNIIDAKSSWTQGHSVDVAKYAVAIAREMGMKTNDIETLKTASLLHDIGKVGTYDVILDKPDELDPAEEALIRQHTIKGEDILHPIKGLRHVTPIIRSHHERVDGKGYPDRLKGNEIHPLAKILCVADSYDAMISDRPYRLSQGKDYAMSEISRCSGTQFDTEASNAFLRILGRETESLSYA